ncbi:MAG: tetraacyldisaccharide 4'-kinase [Alphaproteobacteria bacterium]|jgi:tetraacyldisaccharide 4'-kinase
MKAPEFWQTGRGPWPRLLAPLGYVFGALGGARRALVSPARASVPVICVGNLTAGGTGKTPVAITLAAHLKTLGACPHFLTRGYGGALTGPIQVDTARHSAREVGDEALLLAHAAPTWVAGDRHAGADAAIAAGADRLILDDGFQDARLAKDISLIVIDGTAGFGNGRVIPAGPLRETLAEGLARAQAAIIVGTDKAGIRQTITALQPNLQVFAAHLQPAPEAAALKGVRVLGFAGIGRPEKFAKTLHALGCEIADFIGFADHHPYNDNDQKMLRERAGALSAQLVTTAKDAVRLSAAMRDTVKVVEVSAMFDDTAALTEVIAPHR